MGEYLGLMTPEVTSSIWMMAYFKLKGVFENKLGLYL